MKGFAMQDRDILIDNNEISLVVGASLTQQMVQNVLSTNLREWFLDWTEGINFHNILGKGITEEMVRYEVQSGLEQVDDSFQITEFSFDVDRKERKATVYFKAVADSGQEVGGEYTWR